MAAILPSSQWIIGLCSVVFDIDVGNRINHILPASCLSPEEQQDVAFHAFPDSMSMELHARTSIKDSTFFFRIRRRGTHGAADNGGGQPSAGGGSANGSSHVGNGAGGGQPGWAGDEAFLYGFVFCRQRQDASLRRGGEQHSLVVLAEHPLSGALAPLSAAAGQAYFSALHGGPGAALGALQQVYDEVCRWPPPVAGPSLQLPVGFTAITARLPALHTLPHPSAVTAPEQYAANTLRTPSQRSFGASRRNTATNALLSAHSGASWTGPAAPGASGDLDHSGPLAAGGLDSRSGSVTAAAAQLSPAGSGAAGLQGQPSAAGPSAFSMGSAGSGLWAMSAASNTGAGAWVSSAVSAALQTGPSGGGGGSAVAAGAGAEANGGAGVGAEAGKGAGAEAGGTGDGNGGAAAEANGAGGGSSSNGGSGNAPPQTPAAGVKALPPSDSTLSSPFSAEASQTQVSVSAIAVDAPGATPTSHATADPSGAAPARAPSGDSDGDAPLARQATSALDGRQLSGGLDMLTAELNVGLHFGRGSAGGEAPAAGAGPEQASDRSPGGSTKGSNAALNALGSAPTTRGASFRRASLSADSQLLAPMGSLGSFGSFGPGDAGATHGAFHEMDVYSPLSGHLQRLWQLWEMTLLGRALMVVAPTPGETSAAIAALISLVAPLPYAPDFRPYYCIHDPAFARLAAGTLPGPEARDVPTLLGVTNLYFIRALPHWPNVLSVGKREGAPASAAPVVGSLAAAASAISATMGVQALRQRAQGASVLLSGHSEALWSAYKPLMRPDQGLLSRLLQPKPGDVKSKVSRIAFVNSDAIRRHFADLTAAFLAPFSRYFEPGPDGRVPGWNSEEFLFGLRTGQVTPGVGAYVHQAQLLMERLNGSVASLVELYARFTSSLNFAAWFAARRRPVAHLIAPGPGGGGGAGSGPGQEGGMSSWFASASKHLNEVKVIEMFFSIEKLLMEAQAEAASTDAGDEAAATVSRLERELALLFFSSAMSEELQLTCVSSPARRALLGSLPLSAGQAARLRELLHMLEQ